ncbi:hypothetical protein [uncultured Sneathiella sp.]|uniref:hypothetical protein n=1 Tax=uncultured Sneathiella sp. TaxID=879315 RepID=UPI0030EBB3AC|tara:strand:+ start:2185 stop:2571 length:387 start_codon:yes stop_codon:yes gene_type:complete
MIKTILRGETQRHHAMTVLLELKIDPENLQEIIVQPYKRKRSEDQNKYMWVLNTAIGDHLGYFKQAMHLELMKLLLPPIIHECPSGMHEEYTTKHLRIKEMSAYLEKILFWAGIEQIPIPPKPYEGPL